MAALYCSSSSNKLSNYIDLTGSDEDNDDDVQILLQAPVADPHAPSKLPLEFSGAIQDTLLEAAKESTRRLAAGHMLATVPSRGSSKAMSGTPSKRLNKSALAVGSPRQAVSQRPLPSSTSAIALLSSSPRAVSKSIGPALARTQTTIDGFFHRPVPSSEGQPDTDGGRGGAGSVGEICQRIALKKRHITREGGDELGLIEQINQSSLTNEEKAVFVRHFRHSGGSQPLAERSGTEPDVSKKVAIYLLRTRLFPYIVGVIDSFKDIKTPEERKQIGREVSTT